MRLIDRLLARADTAYNESMYTGAYQVVVTDSRGRSREGVSAGRVRENRDSYKANGVVFGCVAKRMALFSQARFKFQALSDMHLMGNLSASGPSPLLLLEYPWPNATTGELLARMDQDVSHAGNSFIAKIPAGDKPFLLQLRPEAVTIVSEERTDDMGRPYKVPIGYDYDVRALGIAGEPRYYTVEEVCHYSPIPDPEASWRGMSWITPVLREVGADQALTHYKTYHLANGAFPGLVIKSPRKMSNRAIEVLRARIFGRYGGPPGAGKTIVLDEGQDAMVAGHSLEQLQADLVTKAGERRICSAADVPLEVMGLEPGDYQAAMRRMADMWGRPHWAMACAALQHLLDDVPEVGVRLWYDVSGIAALREGELARGQTMLVKAQAVAAFVTAGYSRKTSVQAADSGDITLLEEDPNAPTPGGGGSPQAPGGPGGGPLNNRAPQAALPQGIPGVGHPNVPNALPPGMQTMPQALMPPRGPRARRDEFGWLWSDEPASDGNGHGGAPFQ